jgi:DNA-binding transcriptional MerR regulator
MLVPRLPMSAPQRYSVGQVAALTGVTIRTLHHYDSIGLLPPSARLVSGKRLYSPSDLLKLQQILTLRYLGFELRQIRDLLQRPDFDVIASLRIQRGVLGERIAELQRIDASVSRLLEHRVAGGEWDWSLVADASALVHSGLEQKGAKMNDYYTTDEISRRAEELARGPSGDRLRALEREWRVLLQDVHAHLDLPPESAAARELAARWDRIRDEARPLFQNRDKLWQSIGRAHLDGRYDHIDVAGHAEDYAFIQRVKEAAGD